MKSDLMLFDPADRSEKPYPSQADQYRAYHGSRAWLYNPYTGAVRTPEDVGSDPFGLALIQKPVQPMFSGVTCKGSYRLNTACGTCEKCKWEREHL